MRFWLRTVSSTLTAGLATAAVASLLQTQINLHALTQLGLEVGWRARGAVTVEDFARFGPVMFGFSLAGGVLALGLQAVLRRLGLSALPCALLAGVAGLAAVLALLRSVIPMPAIAAIRELPGYALLSLCGLVGGYASYTLTARAVRVTRQHSGMAYLLPACLILLPLGWFLLMRPTAQGAQPPAATGYQVATVADGLQWPWSLAELPDGRLLVTEMAGRLKLIDRAGTGVDVNVSQLPAGYQRERVIGLMDIVLSPDFDSDRRVYLTQGYRDQRGVGVRLIRGALERVGDAWSMEQVEILFESTPKASDGNNGGRVAFLDAHTLLMTVGDGSARREEAQNVRNSLGKVMRIELAPGASVATLYTSGHRNPQGIVHDPVTDSIYVSEHGPRGGDELNRLRPGANYGWPMVSHGIDYPFARLSPFTRHKAFEDPEVIWSPSIAPSGLAVYQGALFKEWQGDLLVPALRERSIRRFVRDGDRVVRQERLLSELDERIRDVMVAADGYIYALTDGADGKVLRLAPKDAP